MNMGIHLAIALHIGIVGSDDIVDPYRYEILLVVISFETGVANLKGIKS